MSKHPDSESHEGFVSRWSRRKSSASQDQEVRSKTAADGPEDATLDKLLRDADLPPDANGENNNGLPATLKDADPKDPGGATPDSDTANDGESAPAKPLPPIESLTEQSDYSAFMSPEVSQEIRNLALRKLFRSPMFNIRDGLDDYDEDFTTFEKLGNIVTADMRHHAERKERERAQREQAESDLQAQAQADETASATEDADNAEATVAADETPTEDQDDPNQPATAAVQVQDDADVNGVSIGNPAENPANATADNPANNRQPSMAGKLRRRPNQT